jgi:hypothetical protein
VRERHNGIELFQIKRTKKSEIKEAKMVVRWFLFETKLGELLLALLERWAGLCVVDADWLGEQPSGIPTDMIEAC